MLFQYKVLSQNGQSSTGEIEAQSSDLAISALQSRGYIVVSVNLVKDNLSIKERLQGGNKVGLKDVVLLSRQLATLFEAQVSVTKAFGLLAENTQNLAMQKVLKDLTTDIQGGLAIEVAMQKHPEVFSPFYIGMMRAGSEAGKLQQSFTYLADYLERQYELTSKVRNAMIYPGFIVFTFVVVMVLILTVIIPQLSEILQSSGQELPFTTKAIIAMSEFTLQYGIYVLILLVIAVFMLVRYIKQAAGKDAFDHLKLTVPYFNNLFRKLYLARIADNLNTMLAAGIPVIRALEITRGTIGNKIYEGIIEDAIESVKGGQLISNAFGSHTPDMPNLMVQMMRIGEESGSLGVILTTLTRFYKREVDNAVDTLLSLIEPIMIVLLALGVGTLLVSVLMPMYNLASAF